MARLQQTQRPQQSQVGFNFTQPAMTICSFLNCWHNPLPLTPNFHLDF